MHKILFIKVLFILIQCWYCNDGISSATKITDDPCEEFNSLYLHIRDGDISKDGAVIRINELIPKINKYFIDNGGAETKDNDWVFPLRGYGNEAIGGTNGSGYITDGYNFFDGNKHGGHPAHDIFIFDRNQDCIDDNTNSPVDVLSMSSGVVVSLTKEWQEGSELRGGKFIIIYDTFSNALFYYAHNNTVDIHIGDIVKAGDKIGEVGRSGLNAHKKRSPTHLHISFFLINEGDIKPDNIYKDLLGAKLIN
ncbi:MAG: M23 family metallopeptidase [Ignavibacteria bacterium]